MNETAKQSFWSKVARGGPDECWLWTGCLYAGGYGAFKPPGAKQTYAHRYSYEMHFGSIPAGKVIMHTCDNRRCVNPRHLRLGTHADNVADRHTKGRTGSNVLTLPQVRAIKSALKLGRSARRIARDFGVGESTIRNIRNGRTWTNVVPRQPGFGGKRTDPEKLTPSRRKALRYIASNQPGGLLPASISDQTIERLLAGGYIEEHGTVRGLTMPAHRPTEKGREALGRTTP